MSKPMLIEALRPGMRAKVPLIGHGEIIVETSDDGGIIFDVASKASIPNIYVLRSTKYEIIPDEPKPWKSSEGDYGFVIDGYSGEVTGPTLCYDTALRTKQAAEHKAKLDRIFTAILNMPGYGGNGARVAWTGPGFNAFRTNDPSNVDALDFEFDSYERAWDAAKYANELMEASHA